MDKSEKKLSSLAPQTRADSKLFKIMSSNSDAQEYRVSNSAIDPNFMSKPYENAVETPTRIIPYSVS